MKFNRKILFLPLCLFFWGYCHVVSAAIIADDDINIVITEPNEQIPLLIRQRMQTSIAVIAQQLLSGKQYEQVAAQKIQYEDTIEEVFNKILVGYTVTNVSVEAGQNVNIIVRLLPWSDTINKVDVTVKTDGVSPEIATLALQDIQGIDKLFKDNLRGLPIDAVDWSNGILKHNLNDFMQKKLPEFRADFDMQPGETTKVAVTIYPRMPVVRTVDLRMRSNSMPNVYLLQERLYLQSQTDILLGVPVEFVERHQDYFARKLAADLDANKAFSLFNMHTKVNFAVGEKTQITTYSDTKDYNINIQGWSDFGRDDDKANNVYRLHLGKIFKTKHELFTQLFFLPQETEADWAAGYYYHFNDKWRLGGRYFFDDDIWSVDAKDVFDDRWLGRFSYMPENNNWEAAIRYKVHDFISLEYVLDQDDGRRNRWIRLIGNF